MAQQFTLWDGQVFNAPSPFDPNKLYILGSAEFDNSSNSNNAARIEIEFEGVSPDDRVTPVSYRLKAVLEAQRPDGSWYPIGYQFSDFYNLDIAPRRQIILQSGLANINPGIDEAIYVGNSELSRISQQSGSLPEKPCRVCLYVIDSDPSGAGGFTSVTVTASGERYNA